MARGAIKLYRVRDWLQWVPDILARTRDTHSPTGPTSHPRRENLRGAFSVARAAEITGSDVFSWMMSMPRGPRPLRVPAYYAAPALLRCSWPRWRARSSWHLKQKVSRFQGFRVSEFQRWPRVG